MSSKAGKTSTYFPRSLVRKSVRAFAAKFPSAEDRGAFIRLDLNEISGLHSKAFLKKIGLTDEFTVNTYTAYRQALRAISSYARVPKTMVHFTNGSDDAIPRLIRLFFEPGAKVLLPLPTFPTWEESMSLHGINIVRLPYETKEESFDFPMRAVRSELKKGIAGIAICSPNNPLGSRLSKGGLLELAKRTEDLSIPLIVDEAYFEYGGMSAVPLIRRFPHVVVLRTFSKFFGFAGLRVGYVIAHPSIIEEFHKITLPWDVNHPAVRAVTVALRERKHFIKELAATKRRKTELEHALRKKGASIYRTYTNFIICKVPHALRFTKRARKNGLLVKPLTAAARTIPILGECVRITVPGKDTFRRAVQILEKTFAESSRTNL